MIGKDYLSNTNSLMIIFWDGDLDIKDINQYAKKANKIASANLIELNQERSPRLLALWDKPKFVWRLKTRLSATDEKAEKINVKSIEQILMELCNWNGTKRLGLLSTTYKDNEFHPSQDMKTEIKSLKYINKDLLSVADVVNNNYQPIMTIWQ